MNPKVFYICSISADSDLSVVKKQLKTLGIRNWASGLKITQKNLQMYANDFGPMALLGNIGEGYNYLTYWKPSDYPLDDLTEEVQKKAREDVKKLGG